MVEKIKKTYLEMMANYYYYKKCTGPWTREWVQHIIQMLNENEQIIIKEWSVYERILKDAYIYKFTGNKSELMRVLKSTDNTVNTVPVVPWEDSFDIIWKAHLACGHGNVTQTMNLIKSNYFINLVFIAILLKACMCQKEKVVSHSVHYNSEGSLQILDMTLYPDKEFKYVLIYSDVQTGLIQLRPLAEVNELEISLELVKIFTDLGPPRKLVVFEPYFYDKVIDNVNKVLNPCRIELELDVILNENQTNNRLDQVSSTLNKWMKMNKSMNWVIGCYLVQWKMNVNQYGNKNPYNIVFGNNRDMNNTTIKEVAAEDTSNIEAEDIVSTENSADSPSTAVSNLREYIKDKSKDSQLNLHADQFSSYQDMYKQFTANYADGNLKNDLIKSSSVNFTSHQETDVSNDVQDIVMTSDLGIASKTRNAFVEVNVLNDEKILSQNDIETPSNKLIKTEFETAVVPVEIQEETSLSCDIKQEMIIDTSFVCWRCKKEVDCSNRIQDSLMDITEIFCQSCIKLE